MWGWWFERIYRRGNPPWDSGVTPPEVLELVETLSPGRALDVGCGTGTNVAHLASLGWEVVGVDFSPTAVALAQEKIAGIPGASVMRGDVTRLDELGLRGGFDLMLDIGCFHSISRSRRDAYARGAAEMASSGCELMMFCFARRPPLMFCGLGVTPLEMLERFGTWFEPVGRIRGTRPSGAAYYRMRRR